MPINLHGTDYQTVAERLDVAHGGGDGRPKGIQSISTEFLPVGTALLCRATVTFQDGRAFHGTSEVPIDSKQPAERDAPFECGETSAVGRALANAGYPGSDKGLAGAEEVQRPPRRPVATKAPPLRSVEDYQGTPNGTPITARQSTPIMPIDAGAPAPEPDGVDWPEPAPYQPTPLEEKRRAARTRYQAAYDALVEQGKPPRWDRDLPGDFPVERVERYATMLEVALADLTAVEVAR